MSGWHVGDLALCIKQDDWRQVCADGISWPTEGPRPGSVHVVVKVCPAPVTGVTNLFFSEFPDFTDGAGYSASRFRKVTPGTDIEGVEERRRIPVGEPA